MAIEAFVVDFDLAIEKYAKGLSDRVAYGKEYYVDSKKHFAMEYIQTASIAKYEKSLLFTIWDGKPALEAVLELLRKNCNTQTKLESVRAVVGDLIWNRYHKVVEIED